MEAREQETDRKAVTTPCRTKEKPRAGASEEMAKPKSTLIRLVLLVFGAICSRATQGADGLEGRTTLDAVLTGDEFAPGEDNRKLFGDYMPKDESAYGPCPDGYPAFGKLGDLLRAWSPNEPDVPEGGVIERLHVSNSSQ